MALKAREPHFLPVQHARVGGPVRFVARGAGFEAHRRMLERERPALVPVALEAARFVGGTRRAMRIVAIHAGHFILRHFVAKWLLKLRVYTQVATAAEAVDLRGNTRYQPCRPVRMHLVADHARDLVFHMAALNTLRLLRSIQVATKADLVGPDRVQLARVTDLFGGCGLRVLRPRAMATLAAMLFPATPRIRFDSAVRTLQEAVVDVFVARLTGLRTSVFFAQLFGRCGDKRDGKENPQRRRTTSKTWHEASTKHSQRQIANQQKKGHARRRGLLKKVMCVISERRPGRLSRGYAGGSCNERQFPA